MYYVFHQQYDNIYDKIFMAAEPPKNYESG